jgi:hypothetical protein
VLGVLVHFLKSPALPLDFKQQTDADTTTFIGWVQSYMATATSRRSTSIHPLRSIWFTMRCLFDQLRAVEIHGHSSVLSAGNELSKAGKGIWRYGGT